MKHNPSATANSLAVIGAAAYVICWAWVSFSRDTFMSFFGQWAHGIDLAALPFKQPDFGSAFFGLITFTIASWLVGWFFATVYNSFSK